MTLKEFFPYVIIAILMFFLITGSHKTTEVITIPAKQNTFQRENPKAIVEYDTIYRDSIIEKIVIKENPVNQELLKKYEEAKDSLQRFTMFKSAITKRRYKEVFNDKNQSITVLSEVTGTLDRQELSYDIAEQEIKIKNPSEGVYIGLGIQASYRTLQLPQPEANISFLKNKQMYTIGIGTEQIRINYKRKIF